MSLMNLSVTVPLELPWASVSMLPRSPTWRFSSVGAPWVLPWGLTGGRYRVSFYPTGKCWEGREPLRPESRARTVGAGRGAAVGVVTKGVDVHATLGIGIMAGDVPGDGGRGGLGLLFEDDGASDLGVTTDDSD